MIKINKCKKVKIASVSLVIALVFFCIHIFKNFQEENQGNKTEVMKVCDKFITDQLTVGIKHNDDYSTIDKEAKIYKDFIKKRNLFLKTWNEKVESPEYTGKAVDQLISVSYHKVKINGKSAEVRARITESFRYKEDKVTDSNSEKAGISYFGEIKLVKRGKNWFVWAADTDCKLCSPFDSNFNILEKLPKITSEGKKSSGGKQESALEREINNYFEENMKIIKEKEIN